MDIGLAVAGSICLGMGVGHTMIGVRWVLPGLTEEHVPGTPFGPPSMSLAMIQVTWFIVTIFVVGLGGILMTLAWDATADAKTLLLRWLAVMWLFAATMAVSLAWRRNRSFRHLLRLPVPLLWVIVGVLCWTAT